MSTVITSTPTMDFPMHALGQMSGGQPVHNTYVPLPGGQTITRNNLKNSLRLSVPNWNFQFDAPIIQVDESESALVVKVALDTDAAMILRIGGSWPDPEIFRYESMNVGFVEREIDSPRACFVTGTFSSLLQLAPTIHDLLGTTIDMPSWEGPLPVISAMLQRRQLAYRLMVIERALGIKFLLLPDCSEQEKKGAAFIYRAISERRFVAAFDREEFPLLANEKNARKLAEWRKKKSIALAYDYKTELFGAEFSLGRFQVKIADALIENHDEAERAMAWQDGKPVPLIIRSLRGEAEWNFLDMPPLPPIIWEDKIQQLIDLDRKLGEALADRYIALATATLDGLSDEEKVAVTVRPELDVEAFM